MKFYKVQLSRIYKNLLSNFTWLTLLQGTNLVLPLLIYPYLIRALGIDKFGLIVFAQAVAAYFITMVDYGFNISATRSIAFNKNNKNKIGEIVGRVLVTKTILCFFSFLILIVLVTLINQFSQEQPLFLLSFTLVIGQVYFPVWFFQGLEKMHYQTWLNALAKIVFALLVFSLVHDISDYIYVNLLLGASNFLAGIISIGIIWRKFKISISISAGYFNIIKELKEGWHLFISSFTVFVSTNSNLLILGFFANPVVLGYYSIAEKLYMFLRAIAIVLYQGIYPRVCLLANESFAKLLKFLRQFVRVVILIFLPVCFFTFILADEIIFYFAGDYVPTSALLLRILSFAPLIAALNIPACQTLLAYDFKKSYATVSVSGAIINLLLNFILIPLFMAFGAAISALITEILVTMLLYVFLNKYHNHYSITRVLNIISTR